MTLSIIVPCRNEEAHIGLCLESILSNKSIWNEMEIIVVDGESEDRTLQIVMEYQKRFERIYLFPNPGKIAPIAQNIGIKHSCGEYVAIIDAHAAVSENYFEVCLQYLSKYPQAFGVGGKMVTLPKENSWMGRGIAMAITSPFGVGYSTFRTGAEKMTWVDSVYCCCYRKTVFDKVGLYNENIVRGYDFEFHQRIKKHKGKFIYIPKVSSRYYARSALNWHLLKYYGLEGFSAVYPFKQVGRNYLSWSHLVPCAFVLSLVVTAIASLFSNIGLCLLLLDAGSYAIGNSIFTVLSVLRSKSYSHALILPLIFISIHISYGIGSIYAFLKK